MRIIILPVLVVSFLLLIGKAQAQQTLQPNIEKKVAALVKQMSLEEKVGQMV